LNSLSEDILIIDISGKGITSLPDLTRFKNLQELYCSNNKLTSLHTLAQSLEVLDCSKNKLTLLTTLPENLIELYCYYNQLTSFTTLPQNLEILGFINNPIYEIVKGKTLNKIKQNIRTLNNFCHLYYCLQFKKQLRKWLWEK
jgi:hypothetical protein